MALLSSFQRRAPSPADRYDEVFFWRGQHHCLADEARVGWHPEFLERVEALTGGAVHA